MIMIMNMMIIMILIFIIMFIILIMMMMVIIIIIIGLRPFHVTTRALAARIAGSNNYKRELEYRIPRIHSQVNSRRFPEIVGDRCKNKPSFPYYVLDYSLKFGVLPSCGGMSPIRSSNRLGSRLPNVPGLTGLNPACSAEGFGPGRTRSISKAGMTRCPLPGHLETPSKQRSVLQPIPERRIPQTKKC